MTVHAYSPLHRLGPGFPPLPAEVVVRMADGRGICISMGSACSSKKKDRTRVPESMGLPAETALSVIRISTGADHHGRAYRRAPVGVPRAIPPLRRSGKDTAHERRPVPREIRGDRAEEANRGAFIRSLKDSVGAKLPDLLSPCTRHFTASTSRFQPENREDRGALARTFGVVSF